MDKSAVASHLRQIIRDSGELLKAYSGHSTFRELSTRINTSGKLALKELQAK